MRLGVGSYTYTWAAGVPGSLPKRPMTCVDLLDKAASLGVHVAQFCDNLPLIELSLTEIDKFEKKAHELGIEVEVGTRGIAPENLRAHLSLAKRLKSSIVRVVVDKGDHKPSEDEVVALVREVIRDYERAEICLAIENHDRFTAATLARTVERIGSSQIGICLDTVNSFGALEGPDVVVNALAPWTVNLHVKDFLIRRADHMMGFTIEGTPAGKGRLDVPWLLQKLREAGCDPNAILELWTPPEDIIEATIAKEDAWARESVEYLRTMIRE